jgi:hypothetical protein
MLPLGAPCAPAERLEALHKVLDLEDVRKAS